MAMLSQGSVAVVESGGNVGVVAIKLLVIMNISVMMVQTVLRKILDVFICMYIYIFFKKRVQKYYFSLIYRLFCIFAPNLENVLLSQ